MSDERFTSPRRTLFGRLAGAVAAGFAGLLPAVAYAEGASEGPVWPGAIPGRHKLVVDAIAVNTGQLNYAAAFLSTATPPGSSSVILVFRAAALPMALEDAMWAKYRIGESFKIIDPETKAPAVKNPFLRPLPGVLPGNAPSIAHLHELGAIIGACRVALHGQSGALAHNAGVSPTEAAAEWAANLVPGATLLPSGVWAIGRAQEAGCGYCSGGA